ncbi:cytochrome c biogenesis ATP-binding export protein CcmA [Tistrella bauzanensis]|uniref:Cytochrome c biogenesis ATP-binding export protein CcmA n=1 Tax=Tistrella bauzanensis TaxID=657419 RepID=A0ABQ1IE04_9PROT|nr:heme ABC exporter ATP-binding protein CcmA [Tistrella bauzanensis]GGB33952.1 cytochrome c biogenesis ATP-binding export protein CcmA [Tistrella bauzanensis]
MTQTPQNDGPDQLVLHDLACFRGDRPIFLHLDGELRAGHALVVTGRNGSGKSTLLRIIAGFVRADAGQILWNGLDRDDHDLPWRERLQYLGHRDGIAGELSAGADLGHWAAIMGVARAGRADRVVAALTALDIPHLADLPVRVLSAGQRRRLALARLLLAHRPLWVLDEPTTALDRSGSALVAGLIGDHLDRGGMVVTATHLPLGLGDRAIGLDIEEAAP